MTPGYDRIVHAFAGNRLDREARLRTDADAVEALKSRPDARVAVFANDRPLIAVSADESRMDISWLGMDEAMSLRDGPAPLLFLGSDENGAPHFACRLALDAEGMASASLNERGSFIDLRSLAVQGLLPGDQLGLLAHARSLSGWHARHMFCANCGEKTEPADAGYKRICASCSAEHFPRTDPVAIMVVHHGTDCLLGRQPHFPPGSYSALAGFIEQGESIEEAARREIFEESGVRVGRITYHSSQPWPFLSNLMIGLTGEALDRTLDIDYDEIEDARWFSREEALSMLERTHPDGLVTPPSISIAHQMIKSFYGAK